ncbi:MAG: sensor histidine kinase [Thermomicrobiales bacterium]
MSVFGKMRTMLPARALAGLRMDAADRVVHPAVWLLFTVIWLPFLFYPLRDLLAAHPSPLRLCIALAGMALFVVIYLWLMLHDPFRDAPLSPREVRLHVALIAAITAIVLFLTRAYSIDWLWFVMYANMAAAVTLPVRAAAPTILSLTLLTVWVGWVTADWNVAGRIVSPVAAVAVVMIGISRLVVTIRALRAARQEIARLAVAEERLRFSRDVHDLLGHSLSTIAIKTSLARRLLPGDPARAMHELDDVQTVTQEALREVREAVTGYRQPALATEIDNAREILAAAGIACQCEAVAGPLPPAIEPVVAWAVREGVTNVVRHSRTRHATIRIWHADGAVTAEITDDGDGNRPTPLPQSLSGSGLRGLAERAAVIGGSVEARPSPAGGFALRVTLPLVERAPRVTPTVVTEGVR